MSLTRPFSESVLSARKASAALSGEASDYALPGLGKPPLYFISDQGGGWGSPSRDSASPSARFLLSMLTTVSMALWEPTNGQADGKASTVKLKQHPLKLSQRRAERSKEVQLGTEWLIPRRWKWQRSTRFQTLIPKVQ